MSASPSLSTALVHYLGCGDDGTAAWLRLPRSDRRRLAMQAARDQGAGALWSLVAAWLRTDARGGVVPGTLKNYRTGLRALLVAWTQEDLLHPDPEAADAYVRALERRGLQPGTVANRLAAARGLYAALRWARAVLLDPFHDVRAPRDPTPPWEKRLPYDDDEIAARTVALSATLRQALGVLPRRPDGYVLPYRAPISAWRHIQALCVAAGVAPKGMHSLRHAAGTRLYAETGDLETTARHLGHRKLDTTRVYATWSDRRLRETIGRW